MWFSHLLVSLFASLSAAVSILCSVSRFFKVVQFVQGDGFTDLRGESIAGVDEGDGSKDPSQEHCSLVAPK